MDGHERRKQCLQTARPTHAAGGASDRVGEVREAAAAVDAGVGEGRFAPFRQVSMGERRLEVTHRKRYLTDSEIERYGGTEGCMACSRVVFGERGYRVDNKRVTAVAKRTTVSRAATCSS